LRHDLESKARIPTFGRAAAFPLLAIRTPSGRPFPDRFGGSQKRQGGDFKGLLVNLTVLFGLLASQKPGVKPETLI
jgi:hypothetical protein